MAYSLSSEKFMSMNMGFDTDGEYKYPSQTQMQWAIYDPHTATYKTYHQERKIRELEMELYYEKKQEVLDKKEKEVSLQNLIAYYYNR